MPLPKPTFKKPREAINSYEESTWHANDTPIYENEHCGVFRDLYPCVEGHLLFIPKKNDPQTISEAYKLGYYCGEILEQVQGKLFFGHTSISFLGKMVTQLLINIAELGTAIPMEIINTTTNEKN